jgi:hypothetical protein
MRYRLMELQKNWQVMQHALEKKRNIKRIGWETRRKVTARLN